MTQQLKPKQLGARITVVKTGGSEKHIGNAGTKNSVDIFALLSSRVKGTKQHIEM